MFLTRCVLPGLALWCGLAMAQAAPAAQTEAGSGTSQLQVRLEGKDGRTHFQLGDAIELELVFTDAAFHESPQLKLGPQGFEAKPGQRIVNTTDYGDLADTVNITPATGWFQWQGRSGHDYSNALAVDEKGARVGLTLNEGFVFREPGHYEITVTTRRVNGSTLTTEPLGIDIAARPAADEAALVATLNAELGSATCQDRTRAAEHLAWLPGEAAARAKVRWLLDDDADLTREMTNGLASTRDQAMQLQLLKAAWADVSRAPDGNLEYGLSTAERLAKGVSLPGWVMVMGAQKPTETEKELGREHAADIKSIVDSLPQRTGENRRDTAYFLMENGTLSPQQMTVVKPAVLEEFGGMDGLAQSMLLETRWPQVKDSSLVPGLKAMLDHPKDDANTAVAVERLAELDATAARPYAVQAICSANRGLMLKNVAPIREETLPEVDGCLGALLRVPPEGTKTFDWTSKAELAARFATPAILPDVRKGWTSSQQDANVFPILLRDAPNEAIALLDRQPKEDVSFFFPANNIYASLDKSFPPELLSWLRERLKSGGAAEAATAAYELAHHGEPGDRELLQARLAKLRSERGAATDADTENGLESALMAGLRTSPIWFVNNAEGAVLAAGCATDECRIYGRPRPRDEPFPKERP